jgi:hypothetical protein
MKYLPEFCYFEGEPCSIRKSVETVHNAGLKTAGTFKQLPDETRTIPLNERSG